MVSFSLVVRGHNNQTTKQPFSTLLLPFFATFSKILDNSLNINFRGSIVEFSFKGAQEVHQRISSDIEPSTPDYELYTLLLGQNLLKFSSLLFQSGLIFYRSVFIFIFFRFIHFAVVVKLHIHCRKITHLSC